MSPDFLLLARGCVHSAVALPQSLRPYHRHTCLGNSRLNSALFQETGFGVYFLCHSKPITTQLCSSKHFPHSQAQLDVRQQGIFSHFHQYTGFSGETQILFGLTH